MHKAYERDLSSKGRNIHLFLHINVSGLKLILSCEGPVGQAH